MWDQNDWENDNDDRMEENGRAYQAMIRERSKTELKTLEEKIEQGLSGDELSKAMQRQEELRQNISFINDLLNDEKGAEQEQ